LINEMRDDMEGGSFEDDWTWDYDSEDVSDDDSLYED